MKQNWLTLDQKECEEIRNAFESSTVLRDRYTEILERKIDNAYLDMIKKAHYECKDWSVYQADSIGYIRALREMYNLFK